MENKNVGYLMLGISILVIFIIFLFNNAMKDIIDQGRPLVAEHGGTFCPAYGTINTQTYLSLAIAGILIVISLFLIFSKPNYKIVIRKIKDKPIKKEVNLGELNREEKQVYELVMEDKAVFQSDIIEKLSMGKAKVTRILDKLEGLGAVERKRRGLTNIVVLK
ncbi:hypothetical protein HYZ97_01940 [Candidatus Pacearchaeota archaeon]|nr:hypothetical protein [Candidatus Pacearchaeota archaeon]